MAYLTSEQLEKLQTLSNIKLNPSEQGDFLQKLDPIISKLDELWSVDISIEDSPSFSKRGLGGDLNSLRALDTTFEWEKQKNIAKNMMKNIEHEVINNSVVIKSVLI